MSLTLTYSSDLSRVQVAITGLPEGIDTVTVERSTNGLWWETVRGATALPVTGGAASVDDFEFASDVENTYRVVGAAAGLYLPGVDGAYASAPDGVSLDITGDIDIRVQVTRESWAAPAAEEVMASKYADSADDRTFRFSLDASGALKFQWSSDGTTATTENVTSSVTPAAAGLDTAIALRLTRSAATGDVTFWHAADLGGAWTQLGAVQTGPTGPLHAGAADLEVGARDGGGQTPWQGIIHALELRSGIDGTLVADPAFDEQPTGTSSFTDSVGILWTVHGTAQIIGDPIHTGTITPVIDGVQFKSIRHPFLNRAVVVAGVDGDSSPARNTVHDIQGRSMPVAVTDVRGSDSFTLTLRTTTAEESRDLDLMLKSGDVFLVQVPPGRPNVPGGYVVVDTRGLGRFGPVSTRRLWPLPCRIVAPPGPGIVGTTLTWRTVFRLYGSSTALINANPTWRDLLATVGSPDDTVVI